MNSLSHHWGRTQKYNSYTKSDHETWRRLYHNAHMTLDGRAHEIFYQGLRAFGISSFEIPRFKEVNKKMQKYGWNVVGVKGFLPIEVFGDYISRRLFPVGVSIRQNNQEYVAEPDTFHDLFGHVPLLVNPDYRNFLEALGCRIIKWHSNKFTIDGIDAAEVYTRLLWRIIEVGVIGSKEDPKILGAAILSSPVETRWVFENAKVIPFTNRVLSDSYREDSVQPYYCRINCLQDMKSILCSIDNNDFLNNETKTG